MHFRLEVWLTFSSGFLGFWGSFSYKSFSYKKTCVNYISSFYFLLLMRKLYLHEKPFIKKMSLLKNWNLCIDSDSNLAKHRPCSNSNMRPRFWNSQPSFWFSWGLQKLDQMLERFRGTLSNDTCPGLLPKCFFENLICKMQLQAVWIYKPSQNTLRALNVLT